MSPWADLTLSGDSIRGKAARRPRAHPRRSRSASRGLSRRRRPSGRAGQPDLRRPHRALAAADPGRLARDPARRRNKARRPRRRGRRRRHTRGHTRRSPRVPRVRRDARRRRRRPNPRRRVPAHTPLRSAFVASASADSGARPTARGVMRDHNYRSRVDGDARPAHRPRQGPVAPELSFVAGPSRTPAECPLVDGHLRRTLSSATQGLIIDVEIRVRPHKAGWSLYVAGCSCGGKSRAGRQCRTDGWLLVHSRRRPSRTALPRCYAISGTTVPVPASEPGRGPN